MRFEIIADIQQILMNLSPDDSIIKALEQLGDPPTEQFITKRRLRTNLHKTPKEQKEITTQLKQSKQP